MRYIPLYNVTVRMTKPLPAWQAYAVCADMMEVFLAVLVDVVIEQSVYMPGFQATDGAFGGYKCLAVTLIELN